jgi:hypothetical protein
VERIRGLVMGLWRAEPQQLGNDHVDLEYRGP